MPANSATSKNKQAPTGKAWLKCGEVNTYAELNKKRAKPKWERDHVPSHAAMLKAATSSPGGRALTKAQKACVKGKLKAQALTIAIPKSLHRGYSRTCGSRNTPSQIKTDAGGLDKAANKDLARVQKRLDSTGSPCAAAYREAARQVRAQDHEGLIKKCIAECTK